MKKKIVGLCVCGLMLVLAGCGKKNNEEVANMSQVVEEQEKEVVEQSASQTTKESEAVTVTQIEELMALAQGSNWSGVDTLGNAYLVTLSGGEITCVVNSADGETTYEGQYLLNEEGMLVFQDELAEVFTDIDFELTLDGDNSCLRIDDVYLTKDSLVDYEERLKSLDLATIAAEYMASGHCWLACMDNQVIVLFFDGQQIQLRYVKKEGAEIIVENVDANWSMKLENFTFFDFSGKKLEDFQWDFQEEGDLKVFTLIDDEKQEMTFYELEKDSIEDGEELAESYLSNQQEPEEVEDLTTVLEGYEGVSIVDAFVAAGLNPQFENRAIFAEKFEIENYCGTAEQNLFLLEAMGGTIK